MQFHGLRIREADRALTEKPLRATSAERILIQNEIKTLYRDLPQPLRLSRIFSILLDRVSTPVEPWDLIAGRCVDRLLTEEEEAIFLEYTKSPDQINKALCFDSGHCTLSWELLISEGISGLRGRVEAAREHTAEEDQRVFYSGILEIYDALERYLLRTAKEAERLGLTNLSLRLTEAADRPLHFDSALQLLWSVALIYCAYVAPNPTLALGRLDQILLPLYRADLESGYLTREQAAEFITDYYCKQNLIMGRGEHQMGTEEDSTTFRRIFCFDSPSYLSLAGSHENGDSAANELTELFVQQLPPSFKNPVLILRYTPGMAHTHPALWRLLTEKALQSASMIFYNDRNVVSSFCRIGIPKQDAQGYDHFGCNWCSLGPNSFWTSAGPKAESFHAFRSEEERRDLSVPFQRAYSPFSWPQDFTEILHELADEPVDATIEDFYRLLAQRIKAYAEQKLSVASRQMEVRRRRSSAVLTVRDCFCENSINTGTCIAAGARYAFQLHPFQMFGTVVDCLIAVDQLVMREKRITAKQLCRAVDANFEGHEEILALCRNAEKYGMDTPLSNYHAKRLSELFCSITTESSRPYLVSHRLFLLPSLQTDTWHVRYGSGYGATPNGRLANQPYSQNSRPSSGACTNGLTAMLNSLLSHPFDGYASGAFNLDVDLREYGGESGKSIFSALLATYFDRGGLSAQVTATDAETLIEAQKHPDEHRDLRVRITGYSGVFVDVGKELQNDIIQRFRT